MSGDDYCDYCADDLPYTFKLRAVGFTSIDGVEAPQVRTWCGYCFPDDEIDPIAEAAMQRAFQAQIESTR